MHQTSIPKEVYDDIDSIPLIKWVNHASYIIEYRGVRLISDPWLFGSAFDNGWELLCDSAMNISDFSNITHIWFSHEHPDHFSPPLLAKIPKEVREGIVVLFQETKDRRVVNFCKKLGFSVLELKNRTSLTLAEGVKITCGKCPPIDSWILVELDDFKILNLNDCIVNNDYLLNCIYSMTGEVDLLMTQFAYAQWGGNPDEKDLLDESKSEKLDRILIQYERFKPKLICPFASFIYFSHKENEYLNYGVATIHEVSEFIVKNTEADLLVMYPGDRWTVGEEWDSSGPLAKYEPAYQSRNQTIATSNSSVSLDKLIESAHQYLETARTKGNYVSIKWWERMLSKRWKRPWHLKIWLWDLNSSIVFDWNSGIGKIGDSPDQCDIQISSHSLYYILDNDWGFGTIRVNGRYRASKEGRKIFGEFFRFGALHSIGEALDWNFIAKDFWRRLSKRFTFLRIIAEDEEPSFLGLWKHLTR